MRIESEVTYSNPSAATGEAIVGAAAFCCQACEPRSIESFFGERSPLAPAFSA